MNISPVSQYNMQNVKSNPYMTSKLAFKGDKGTKKSFDSVAKMVPVNEEKSKFFDPITKPMHALGDKVSTQLAYGFTHILKNEHVKKFILNNMNDKNLVKKLSIAVSLVLSSFYIQQTLTNKKLDDNRKVTLAINQGAVTVLAAASGWWIDDKTDKYFDKYIDRYSAVRAKDPQAIKLYHGIKSAKSIMIFGTIYRFICPVFVTPFSNKLGDWVNERAEKKAKLEGSNKK